MPYLYHEISSAASLLRLRSIVHRSEIAVQFFDFSENNTSSSDAVEPQFI